MSRAQDIFNRIKASNMEAIKGFIATRKGEDLFLEFKRSDDNGAGLRLSNKDRSNLSKCISGFGNTQGGVLVWGVDCSSTKDTADVASALHPITDIKRFEGWVQGVISGCTISPHESIETHAVNETDGNGYLAVLIPKTTLMPLRSIQLDKYYMRAGSNFVQIPHDVLAGMFGRMPQPVLVGRLVPSDDASSPKDKVAFEVVLSSSSSVIAREPFLTMKVDTWCWENPPRLLKTAHSPNYTVLQDTEHRITLVPSQSDKIMPGSLVSIGVFRFLWEKGKKLKSGISVEFNYGCEGCPIRIIRWQVPENYLEDRIFEVVDINRPGARQKFLLELLRVEFVQESWS